MIRHQIIFDLNAISFENQSDDVMSFLQKTFGSAAVGCYAFFKTKENFEGFCGSIDAAFLSSNTKSFEVFLKFSDFLSIKRNFPLILNSHFDQVQLFSVDSPAFQSRFSRFCRDLNGGCLEVFLTNEKCQNWLFIQDDVIEQVFLEKTNVSGCAGIKPD